MTTTAPYGAWASPITTDLITAGQVGLGGGTIDAGATYWTESRAAEGGRASLWREAADGTRTELTPDRFVRDMVHEYGGGGSWAVRDGVVVYSTFPDHTCYVLRDGKARRLTGGGPLRYAGFEVHPERNLVLAVREDHRASDLNCRNELVALRLDSDNADGGTVLVTGADFYASPTLSAGGDLAWLEWDHPNMPWDLTRLRHAPLATDASGVGEAVSVTSGTTAATAPAWAGDALYFLDDASGFWNPYVLRPGAAVERLAADDHDYCYAPWVPGAPYRVLPDGRLLVKPIVDGVERLSLLAHGALTPIATEGVEFTIGGDGATLVSVVEYRDRPARLERLDLASGAWTALRTSLELDLDSAWFSVAEAVSWAGPQGEVHAWYYPPTNPDFAAPAGELPPLKVLSHGGPTGMATPGLQLGRQYWTSRGWAIIDVNYGGSCGYGRDYRQRLRGQWGVVDVRDCVDAARAMIAAGRADPTRLAIEGGSAGGYTTLAALTTSDVFTAGNCLFGIGDLAAMATGTHKFESRYLDGLVGGSPAQAPDLYRERSPIFHLARLSCPMLIQQGADDRVVPPSQATAMADAVRAKHLPVALLVFPDEGHGFRRAETIKSSLEAGLSFFGQVFGYVPVGVPILPVENLPISGTPDPGRP